MCQQCGNLEHVGWDTIDIAMPTPLLSEDNGNEDKMVEYLGVTMSQAVMEALIEQQSKMQG